MFGMRTCSSFRWIKLLLGMFLVVFETENAGIQGEPVNHFNYSLLPKNDAVNAHHFKINYQKNLFFFRFSHFGNLQFLTQEILNYEFVDFTLGSSVTDHS